MKKIFYILFIVATLLLTSCGNMQLIDTSWNYDYVYIKMPDDSVIEGEVDSWKDFSESDCIQVKIKGVTYLTHYCNVVMIDK